MMFDVVLAGLQSAEVAGTEQGISTGWWVAAIASGLLGVACGLLAWRNRRYRAEIQRLSRHDSLTGILNRSSALLLLESEIERVARYQTALSIALIDLDFFKQINHEYGYRVGDEVLQTFCRQVSERIRKTDIFGRHGGEVFILGMPGTSPSLANLVLNDVLRQALALHLPHCPGIQGISFSAGLVHVHHKAPLQEILHQCHSLLAQAQTRGHKQLVSARQTPQTATVDPA